MDLNITLYSVLKLFHILLAIVAVGANATYGVWLALAGKEPQHESFALRGVALLDGKIANPAYVLLLFAGIGMVLEADLGFGTFWIAAALVLYAIVAVLGITQYTPLLRDQIALVQEGKTSTPEFQALSKRGFTLGMTMAIIVLVIVALMVLKPTI
jgi:uncharacterized membrane protein